MKLSILVVVASIGLTVPLSAQEKTAIEADRPDQSETPSIVPAGMFQMENGFSYEKESASSEVVTAPSSLWKYGINDNFELRLITEYTFQNTPEGHTAGLNPARIGFKAKLADEKGLLPKTSFIGHLVLPNLASKELKAEYYAPEFRFAMQHTLSQNLNLGYNLGAEWDGESPEATFVYTASLGYSATEKLAGFVEIYGFAPQHASADHRVDGGLTYLISNNFMVDLSGGFGVSKNAPDYFAAIGFSFRI